MCRSKLVARVLGVIVLIGSAGISWSAAERERPRTPTIDVVALPGDTPTTDLSCLHPPCLDPGEEPGPFCSNTRCYRLPDGHLGCAGESGLSCEQGVGSCITRNCENGVVMEFWAYIP